MPNPLDTLTPAELRTELGAAVLELDRKQDIIAARDAEIARLRDDANILGIAVYRLFETMSGDHSLDIGNHENELRDAYNALALTLAQIEWPTTGETGVNNG